MEINRYYSRYHWPNIIKHEYVWFLLQNVLIYTENNMTNIADRLML